MKIFHAALGAIALSGCLGGGPSVPSCWTIAPSMSGVSAVKECKWDSVRVSRAEVRPPCDGREIAVLRMDGSVAFDRANVFAAAPAPLVKWAACDILERTGLAGRVVPPSSAASSSRSIEIVVDALALDCTRETPAATVSLSVFVLNGRDLESSAKGAGRHPVVAGNFTAAFSFALREALLKAFKEI